MVRPNLRAIGRSRLGYYTECDRHLFEQLDIQSVPAIVEHAVVSV